MFDPKIYKRRKRERTRRFKEAWEAQHGRCYYCRWPMIDPRTIKAEERSDFKDPLLATEDHKLPRRRYSGSREDPCNIVLACQDCNRRKKDQTDEEFEVSHRMWLFRRRLEALTFGLPGMFKERFPPPESPPPRVNPG